mmetsp:Transcript_28317/g.42326  ORF Transcript_28317/g.42326 Transcript_28317/m.42326 type:complete len:607 (+) Transcript_28317:1008-2828(+)
MHGRGVKIMSSGDMYNGQWVADKAQGYGVKLFSNGDRHEGYYEEDKRQGYGTYYWASGDQYMGYWFKGRMCGLGVKLMTNGDSYDGEWFADQAHGFGIKKFANGDTHTGFYQHDVRENEGTYLWVNGDEFGGCWENGEQTGIGEYKYANGDSFNGRWENGRKHGPGYFRTTVSSVDDLEEIVEGSNNDGDVETVQQAESTSSTKVPLIKRTFFEVWSRGSRMHREEVTNMPQDDLPSVADMCKPRSLVQIVHARKGAACDGSTGDRQQRKPLGTLHTESDTLIFADRWRWIWEPDANSGVSGFWGRRLRRADITRSILSVAATSAELDTENTFNGVQDAVENSNDNVNVDVQNESLHVAEEVNEDNVVLQDSLSQVLFAEHLLPSHDARTTSETIGASDGMSLASVGSADLEFASSTNNSSSKKEESLEPSKLEIASSSDEEMCDDTSSLLHEANKKHEIPLNEQGEKKPGSLLKRSQTYTRHRPLSFCSSSSNSTFGRRRIADGAIRLSKRRIRGRSISGSLSKRKKTRSMESQALSLPIPGSSDACVPDKNSVGCARSSQGETIPNKCKGTEKNIVDSMDLSSDIGHVMSPSPRHSGGDASGVL